MKNTFKSITIFLALTLITAAGQASDSTHHATKSDSVEADVALGWLKNGNTRFKKGTLRKDGQSKKDIERLAQGQKPHSIILSCSDSRVPPEVLFDQKLGEIFVVRTAGEAIEPTSIASIEYAVEHLGVKNLVVMGHTQCGAVKAALATMDGKDAGSENLNKLVADIHPRIQRFRGRTPSSDVAPEGWDNVNGVIADLKKRSKILKQKIESKELTISGSLYHVETGDVEFK